MSSFHDKAFWKSRFLWKPRRCELTGKLLWLRYAVEGVVIWAGTKEAVVEFRYHDKKEHLIWLLTH
jgi:hypothetical protein